MNLTDIPHEMTGGVDLTSVNWEQQIGETMPALNKQPDMVRTITGGVAGLALEPVTMPPDPHPAIADKDIEGGLHAVLTEYNGTPVRVVPASRMRTQRIALAASTVPFIVAEADNRRTSLAISVTETAGNICSIYIGNDVGSVVNQGFQLVTNAAGPYSLILTNGDQVCIGVASGNAASVVVSIVFEIQE